MKPTTLYKTLVISILFLTTSYSTTWASSKADQLLNQIKSKLNGYTSYRVSFNSTTQDYSVAGKITVSGSRFTMITPDMEVYYDGETLWNYDVQKNEVNIEALSPNDPNVVINPSKLLALDPADFRSKAINDNTVELTPVSEETIYSKILIRINLSTMTPQYIEITDRETADVAGITISGLEPNVAISKTTFKFDPSKHSDIDIVDFR